MPDTDKIISKKTLRDLMVCDQRVWLELYGDKSQKSVPSTFWNQVRKEERAYFRQVQSTISAGFSIKEQRDLNQRNRDTIDAMKRGEKFIFNGYLANEKYSSSFDVMRLIGHSNEYPLYNIYSTIKITNAEKLTTSIVLEVAYEAQILQLFQGAVPLQSIIFLKDFKQKTVDLRPLFPILETLLKKYKVITEKKKSGEDYAESIAICKGCKTCLWKKFCLPRFIDVKSTSLIPEIGYARHQYLKEHNIHNIEQLSKLKKKELMDLSFDDTEIEKIKYSLNRHRSGKMLIKSKIKSDIFDSMVPVTLALRFKNENYQPTEIYYYENNEIKNIEVQFDEQGNSLISFPEGFFRNKLLLHGIDFLIMGRIADNNGLYGAQLFDISSFINNQVRMPFNGYDFSDIYSNLSDEGNAPSSKYPAALERLKILRKLSLWLKDQLD